jgi:hypothetical protein
MPSGLTASRLSVYSTTPGQDWLRTQAIAAGYSSIGQWADAMALQEMGKQGNGEMGK